RLSLGNIVEAVVEVIEPSSTASLLSSATIATVVSSQTTTSSSSSTTPALTSSSLRQTTTTVRATVVVTSHKPAATVPASVPPSKAAAPVRAAPVVASTSSAPASNIGTESQSGPEAAAPLEAAATTQAPAANPTTAVSAQQSTPAESTNVAAPLLGALLGVALVSILGYVGYSRLVAKPSLRESVYGTSTAPKDLSLERLHSMPPPALRAINTLDVMVPAVSHTPTETYSPIDHSSKMNHASIYSVLPPHHSFLSQTSALNSAPQPIPVVDARATAQRYSVVNLPKAQMMEFRNTADHNSLFSDLDLEGDFQGIVQRESIAGSNLLSMMNASNGAIDPAYVVAAASLQHASQDSNHDDKYDSMLAPASTAPSSNLGGSSNDPAAGSLNGPATGSHDSPGSATPQESATPPTLNPSGGGSASIPITEPVSSSPGASDSVSSSTSTLTLAISIGAVCLFAAGVATLAIYERSRRAKHPDPEDGRPPAPMSLYIPALDYTPPPLKHTVSVPFESMHLEAIDRAYVPSRRVDVDSELFWSDDYMENMTTGFESLRRPLSSLTLESDQVTDDSENIKPLTHYKSIKHLLNDLPDPDM
ncbi:hypothetical protein HDU91_005202, partial [Kappamyces sp. JEL0680]